MREFRVDVFVNTNLPGVVDTLGCWLRHDRDFVRFEEYHSDASAAITTALRKLRGTGLPWVAIRSHHCRPTDAYDTTTA